MKRFHNNERTPHIPCARKLSNYVRFSFSTISLDTKNGTEALITNHLPVLFGSNSNSTIYSSLLDVINNAVKNSYGVRFDTKYVIFLRKLNSVQNIVQAQTEKNATLNQCLRRYRKEMLDKTNQSLPPIPSNIYFSIPNISSGFVLYDSGPSDDSIILIGDMTLGNGLVS